MHQVNLHVTVQSVWIACNDWCWCNLCVPVHARCSLLVAHCSLLILYPCTAQYTFCICVCVAVRAADLRAVLAVPRDSGPAAAVDGERAWPHHRARCAHSLPLPIVWPSFRARSLVSLPRAHPPPPPPLLLLCRPHLLCPPISSCHYSQLIGASSACGLLII